MRERISSSCFATSSGSTGAFGHRSGCFRSSRICSRVGIGARLSMISSTVGRFALLMYASRSNASPIFRNSSSLMN
ncbi:hypothetical protein LCGC14_2401160, partial [marine sediment metagenome]